MVIRIRIGTPNDIKGILELCVQLAEYECALINKVPNREEISERVEKDLVYGKDNAYFVAEDGSNIIAVIKVSDRGNGIARISEAYTKPEYRNSGIMTTLFNRAMSWAAERGLNKVYLTIVKKNAVAHKFWKSLGFWDEEYIGDNIIKMYRDIEKVIGS
ncbi:MAG: GNAT family N-acetyltransferase [Candidatus Micrarchaeia archaeon]